LRLSKLVFSGEGKNSISDDGDKAGSTSDSPGEVGNDAGSDEAPEAVLAASSFCEISFGSSDVSVDRACSEKKAGHLYC
jgi:hypothetical protein